jgi:D-alanyl-D-alanine carboxypeptidase
MGVIFAILLNFIAGLFLTKEVALLSSRASWLTTVQKLNAEAVPVIEKVISDAEKDGMCLVVASSLRTLEQQEKLYDQNPEIAAKPGTSEHERGFAVDFTACPMKDGKRDDSVERLELRKDFNELPEYQWLKENAPKYGLVESYREDNKENTKLPAEPWHWRVDKWYLLTN